MDERITELDQLCKDDPGDVLPWKRIIKDVLVEGLRNSEFYIYYKPHHGSHTNLFIQKDNHVYLDALYDVAGEAVNQKGITWPSLL